MDFNLTESYRRLRAYVKKLFSQGLSPHELALSIAVACFWGVIPTLGVATPAVAFFCLRYKLNLPIAMFITYLISPLHVGLFIPFIYAGEWLLNVPHLPITWEAMKDGLQQDFLQTILDRGWQISYGLLGWLCIALPTSTIIYAVLKLIFNKRRSLRAHP